MFKKMIKSAVAALIASSATSAIAADLNGDYTATQANGQEIRLHLESQGQSFSGEVNIAGQRLPIAGRQANGYFQGTFRAPNGQDVQINGMQTQGGVSMITNGVKYDFGYANRNNQQNDRPRPTEPGDMVANPQAAPISASGNVDTFQGEIFSTPVPQGWRQSQSSNEVLVAAPDASMSFGFVGLERFRAMDAMTYLKFIVEMYGNKNLQVLGARQINYQGATQAIEAKISFTSPNGNNYAGWMRVAVFVAGGQMNGYAIFTAATPERFDRVSGQLQAMAEKIQITNATLAFDRARALNNIQMVKNRPMDDTVTSGYWDRTRRTDAVMARGSDVRRDSYISTDSSTGQQYWHGQAAYDPTRGGVVNPERPTEILTPADHWQGH